MDASIHTDPAGLEIAIVGMAGRFPGAGDLEAFWRLVKEGREGLTRFGDDDLRRAGVDEQRIANPNLIRSLGLLHDVDRFDARFFGFSPGDAELLDPQHRFFLETAWEALENAGCMPEKASGHIGVFAGCGLSHYALRVATDPEAERRGASFQKLSANEKDHLTTCAAYRIGLTGPAVTVQTSCSTSLVAVHMACRALLCGECDVALAGGASVGLGPASVVEYQEGNILADDGRCRPFDAAASGTVVSNAVGVVVLKRLQDAIEDGDTIRAVILASALNNDGAVKVGYVAPSVTGQSTVIAQALQLSGVSAETIQYVETHGTATQKGDPVEFEALVRAFRHHTARTQYCALGAVKANIGHTDTAAGVAGLIKTVLSLERATLPPLVHFEQPNAQIDFTSSPFYASRVAARWDAPDGHPRRAAVSSFGVGGTNAHLILQEAPAAAERALDATTELVTLSARTPAALRESVGRLREHLRAHPNPPLCDVAFTLRVGRRDLRERMYCVGDRQSVLEQLDTWVMPPRSKLARAAARVALALSAATGQLVHVCRACFRANEDFAQLAYEVVSEDLQLESGERIIDLLTDEGPVPSNPVVRFLCHVLLFRWLGILRIEPIAIVADAQDEVTSACLAGAVPVDVALEHFTRCNSSDGEVACSEARIAYWSAGRHAWVEAGEVPPPLRARDGEPGSWPDLDQRASCILTAGDLVSGESRASGLSLFHAGEEGSWPQVLRVIGELWRQEVPADTTSLFAGRDRRRVPLPTYPFERERYWIEPTRARAAIPPPPTVASSTRIDKIEDWFYTPVYRQLPPLRAATEAPQNWIVFCGKNDGVAAAFAARERSRGASVFVVDRAAEPAGGVAEYSRICKQIRLDADITSVFVLFDSYVEEVAEATTPAELSAWFSVPLFLAQALGELTMERAGPVSSLPRVCIALVSRGLQSWDGESDSVPEKALAAALLNVVSQEYSHVTTRVIDLAIGEYGTYAKGRRFDLLCAELESPEEERHVLLRGAHRWTRDFQPTPAKPGNPVLRSGGIYLITGGLGGIGLELASFIASQVSCTLVLLSRREFPDAATSDRLRQIAALGSTLHVVSGDVTDAQHMRSLKQEVEARFGSVKGIVHAAGSAPQSLVQRMTPESVKRVLDAKVRGTQILYDVFSGAACEFVALFSSLRALTGGVGHGDYAAANAYLDAFAERPRPTGITPVLSINWDGWDGIGMSQARGAAHARAAGAFAPMSAADAVQAFQLALAMTGPRVVVSSHDLKAVRRAFDSIAHSDVGGTQAVAPRRGRDGLNSDYVAPRDDVETAISSVWEELLGITPLGIEDSFVQLGGDSVTSLQVTARAGAMGIHLKPFDSLTHDTVAALAKALRDRPATTEAPLNGSSASDEVPLTPIQQWFFDQDLRVQGHFNQAFLLRATQRLEPKALERALHALLEQHDALRSRFVKRGEEWKQSHPAEIASGVLRLASGNEAIESVCARAQATLDLAAGRVFIAILFDRGADEPQRLLICAHHLVVDVLSWRILLEDLALAYSQAVNDEPIRLPARSASFGAWAERVSRYARSDAPAKTLSYWEAQANAPVASLPADFPGGADTVASALAVTREWDLGADPAPSSAPTLGTFLTALGNVLARRGGGAAGSIDLENHGREELFDDLDVSRTVGWFTTLFPFVLEVRSAEPPEVALARVGDALAALPNRGFDFGVLSCLAPRRLRRRHRGEILVLWLGRLGDDRSRDGTFQLAAESPGATQAPDDRRLHPIEIMARVSGTRLQVTITFSRNRHRSTTMERFADELLESFARLAGAAAAAPDGSVALNEGKHHGQRRARSV